jgi:uncharacterized protein DUF4956
MQDQLKTIYNILSGTGAPAMAQIGIGPFVFLMGVSLAGSLLASFLYLQFYSSRATGSQVYRAFPLLGLSITAIFVCIQFSLPLSLGLLGALSIVRFRTPIKEPEEIGFIMLVIAASIATATFKLAFVGVLFGVALLALVVQDLVGRIGRRAIDGTLVIALPEAEDAASGPGLADVVRTRLKGVHLESISKNGPQLVYAYQFSGGTSEALLALQREIAATSSSATINVFLNRPVAL